MFDEVSMNILCFLTLILTVVPIIAYIHLKYFKPAMIVNEDEEEIVGRRVVRNSQSKSEKRKKLKSHPTAMNNEEDSEQMDNDEEDEEDNRTRNDSDTSILHRKKQQSASSSSNNNNNKKKKKKKPKKKRPAGQKRSSSADSVNDDDDKQNDIGQLVAADNIVAAATNNNDRVEEEVSGDKLDSSSLLLLLGSVEMTQQQRQHVKTLQDAPQISERKKAAETYLNGKDEDIYESQVAENDEAAQPKGKPSEKSFANQKKHDQPRPVVLEDPIVDRVIGLFSNGKISLKEASVLRDVVLQKCEQLVGTEQGYADLQVNLSQKNEALSRVRGQLSRSTELIRRAKLMQEAYAKNEKAYQDTLSKAKMDIHRLMKMREQYERKILNDEQKFQAAEDLIKTQDNEIVHLNRLISSFREHARTLQKEKALNGEKCHTLENELTDRDYVIMQLKTDIMKMRKELEKSDGENVLLINNHSHLQAELESMRNQRETVLTSHLQSTSDSFTISNADPDRDISDMSKFNPIRKSWAAQTDSGSQCSRDDMMGQEERRYFDNQEVKSLNDKDTSSNPTNEGKHLSTDVTNGDIQVIGYSQHEDDNDVTDDGPSQTVPQATD